MPHQTSRRGFAFLYVVVIVGAIMTAAALAAGNASGFAGNRIRSYQTAAESRMLLMRCAETVLMQIRITTTLTGSGTVPVDAGSSCSYTITGSSVPKTLTIVATDDTLIRRATITISQVTPIMLTRWVEGS